MRPHWGRNPQKMLYCRYINCQAEGCQEFADSLLLILTDLVCLSSVLISLQSLMLLPADVLHNCNVFIARLEQVFLSPFGGTSFTSPQAQMLSKLKITCFLSVLSVFFRALHQVLRATGSALIAPSAAAGQTRTLRWARVKHQQQVQCTWKHLQKDTIRVAVAALGFGNQNPTFACDAVHVKHVSVQEVCMTWQKCNREVDKKSDLHFSYLVTWYFPQSLKLLTSADVGIVQS